MPNRSAKLALYAMAPNSWNSQWVNRQQLLSRLGVHHHIVYSTGAWFVWDRGTADWRDAPWTGAFDIQDNVLLDRAPRLMMRWQKLRYWDEYVVRHHAARLRRSLAGNLPAADITYVCHPLFLPYVRPLGAGKLVFHVYDLYSHQPGWNDALAGAQAELLRNADLVFCPTNLLADELKRVVDRDIRILPNAADVKPIEAAVAAEVPDPADLAEIPHPRIGYIGSIHPQLDLALIATLAARNAAWHFVLIGPESKTDVLHASDSYRRCQALPNVHFLGERHRAGVPAYLVNMDVNVMFYRAGDDSWTKVAYPLKLHEYFASGRPVVSSELQALDEFRHSIAFASDVPEWEDALSRAIDAGAPGTAAQRRAIAAQNSWDHRAETLRGWLEELAR